MNRSRNFLFGIVFTVLIIVGISFLAGTREDMGDSGTGFSDLSWLETYLKSDVDSENVRTSVLREIPAENIAMPDLSEIDAEKENFISATRESLCILFAADSIVSVELNEKIKQIYLRYGFDAENDKAMNKLIQKYKDDIDFINASLLSLDDCACSQGEVFDMDMKICIPR